MALGKLGDQRAIPLLIKMIEEPIKTTNNDGDSSDGFFSSGGTGRLVVESCLALSTFISIWIFIYTRLCFFLFFQGDQRVKKVLLNGINREDTREVCLAVLSVCTEEKQFLDELEKMLTEGNTLDYMVAEYFKDHAEKSQEVHKLLKLNEEIHKNKNKEDSNDDD